MLNNYQDYNILLDYGHGGINEKGEYTTAPKKQFKHKDGVTLYEGVINREIGNKVYIYLEELGLCPSITVEHDDPTDLSLKERVKIINDYNPKTTFAFSLHNNASPKHNARGSEIFTSRGETVSDVVATYVGESIQKAFPNMKFRADFADGDLDKEAGFYILKNTKCPCILIEIAFFDNKYDRLLLESETFKKKYAWAIATGILKFIKTLP